MNCHVYTVFIKKVEIEYSFFRLLPNTIVKWNAKICRMKKMCMVYENMRVCVCANTAVVVVAVTIIVK